MDTKTFSACLNVFNALVIMFRVAFLIGATMHGDGAKLDCWFFSVSSIVLFPVAFGRETNWKYALIGLAIALTISGLLSYF